MFHSFINDHASDGIHSEEVEDEAVTVREDDFDVQDDDEEEQEDVPRTLPLQPTQESVDVARAFLPTSDLYNNRRG